MSLFESFFTISYFFLLFHILVSNYTLLLGGINLNLKEEELTKLVRIGLLGISVFLLCFISFHSISDTVSVFFSSEERKLPIYCVEQSSPKVSISFDAAWGNEDTQNILDILKKYDVKATFFMTGGWVDSYPKDVKKIAKAGHDLGNHSQNHKQMSQLSSEECISEIQQVNDKIEKLTGKTPILFRPPYGDYNNTLIEATNACNCYCIQWDVDSLDWKNYGVDSIITTILDHKALGNGSIILMHNGAKYTKDALPSVIEGLQDKGFEIVPISELIYKEDYEIDTQGRQHPISKLNTTTSPKSKTISQVTKERD